MPLEPPHILHRARIFVRPNGGIWIICVLPLDRRPTSRSDPQENTNKRLRALGAEVLVSVLEAEFAATARHPDVILNPHPDGGPVSR